MIKWIIGWVIIAFIVILMFYPNSYETLKDNVGKIIEDLPIDKLKFNSEENLILLWGDASMYPCSFMGGEKRNFCELRCGFENLEYAKYKCVNNGLNCYCKK